MSEIIPFVPKCRFCVYAHKIQKGKHIFFVPKAIPTKPPSMEKPVKSAGARTVIKNYQLSEKQIYCRCIKNYANDMIVRKTRNHQNYASQTVRQWFLGYATIITALEHPSVKW